MISLSDPSLLKTTSFINGKWCRNQQQFSVENPANGELIAHVDDADSEQAKDAVLAAKSAQNSWAKTTANHRSELLKKWYQLLKDNLDDLAIILTMEQGKPLNEAKGEINYGASYLEWFAEEAKRAYGDVIPPPSSDKRVVVIKQPVGVVAAVTPWNFPNAMIARKAAAALAAGCTFVVKPAAETPLSALAMAELASRAGIPDGVFNVVIGTDAPSLGSVLTEHPDVAKFSFTGSTLVGKKLISQCASTVKKVSMELGGNAPFIVFDDADLDKAVAAAIASKYRNAGQTCVCTNRLFVHEKVLDTFTDKFCQAVEKLRVDDGLNEGTDIGPLISEKAVSKVNQLIEFSVSEGAKVRLGGCAVGKSGHFYEPTVLTQVTNNMPIAQEEIFGPVSPIISFKEESEVIQMANNTDYGLAAYFFSNDINRIWRVSEALDFGMVGINEGIISNTSAPFGGVKQSGNGREGSKYGLDDYTEIKYLCFGNLES